MEISEVVQDGAYVYLVTVSLSRDELRRSARCSFVFDIPQGQGWLFRVEEPYLEPTHIEQWKKGVHMLGKIHDGKWQAYLQVARMSGSGGVAPKDDVISELRRAISDRLDSFALS